MAKPTYFVRTGTVANWTTTTSYSLPAEFPNTAESGQAFFRAIRDMASSEDHEFQIRVEFVEKRRDARGVFTETTLETWQS